MWLQGVVWRLVGCARCIAQLTNSLFKVSMFKLCVYRDTGSAVHGAECWCPNTCNFKLLNKKV
eukprot:6426693-Amphidinium_carterae.2